MTTAAHLGFYGRIGVACADITPPVGIYARNWGAATHDVAQGVHRPLTLTVLTLQTRDADADESPLVLASADLGRFRALDDERFVREKTLERLHLDSSRLMLCLTHTHAGPVLYRDNAHQPGGEMIAPYLEFLQDTLLTATQQALASAAPATLEFAAGCCRLAANRDLPALDNDNRLLTGFCPDSIADDTLLVGRVTDSAGSVRATLVHYACHPTTLAWRNRLLSPDFVGALRETVERETSHAPCLFLQGASGELAPRRQYSDDTAVADASGRCLGYATLSVLAEMLPPRTRLTFSGVVESGAPLAVWELTPQEASPQLEARQFVVDIPIKLEWRHETPEEHGWQHSENPALRERLRRRQHTRAALGDQPTFPLPLWRWRVGDAYFFGLPAEAYSTFQQQLRAEFSPLPVLPMNVVNGWLGYLPPAPLYDKNVYTVWQTPFDRGSLERVLDAIKSAG